jgi:hypothetical protein
MPNTIKLKSFVDITKEHTSGGTIYPGMLIALGSGDTVAAHAVAGGNARPVMFALEDSLQGKGIGDAYASGDKVQAWYPVPGEEVYAVLADGQSVVIGDLLESNGNGYLRKYVAIADYPGKIVARADEACNLSESSGAESIDPALGYNKRIKVTIV